MILRRYTNAFGEQQEICLSQEDWEKVTEESLEIMLGFRIPKADPKPEPVAEAAPAVKKAPAKKGK